MSSNLIYLTRNQAAEKQARANNTLAKVCHSCRLDGYVTLTQNRSLPGQEVAMQEAPERGGGTRRVVDPSCSITPHVFCLLPP